jgi:transcriptional regulator with XRE-family HTH domain
MAISADEREFFINLGTRIAAQRKSHGVTQTQLAEALDVSQQTVQAYEVGRRRIPVSALPTVAKILAVTLEDLFGHAEDATTRKRGPAPRWQQQIEAIAQMPKTQQRFVTQMLDTVIAQQSRNNRAQTHKGVTTMFNVEPRLIQKLQNLPAQRQAEVESFVEFLTMRESRAAAAQRLGESIAKIDSLNLPPMSDEEINAEIQAVRQARAKRDA